MSPDNGKKFEQAPRCAKVAAGGIRSGNQIIELMSAVILDALDGTIDTKTGNLLIAATGKIQKTVDQVYRYGKIDDHGERNLSLSGPETEPEKKSSTQKERSKRIESLRAELAELERIS